MKWWTDILTGPNNLTVAIGRVLGLLLFINLLLILPGIVTGIAVLQHVKFSDVVAALPEISAYVVAVSGSVAGVITLTNHTEPKA